MLGVVGVTALAVNYWPQAMAWVRAYVALPPTLVAVAVFWGLFVILLVGMHVVLRRITHVIKWERLHVAVQGLGLVLGGLRGVWWAGFLALVLSSSGIGPLQQSVEERSLLGPRLVDVSRTTLEDITSRFPDASVRHESFIPPILSPTPVQ